MTFIGLVPLLVMAVQGYYWALRAIEDDEKAHLRSTLATRLVSAQTMFELLREDFLIVGSSKCIKGACSAHTPEAEESSPCYILDSLREREGYYKAVATYDANWRMIAQSGESAILPLLSPPLKDYLKNAREMVAFKNLIFHQDSVFANIGRPFISEEGNVISYMVAILDITKAARQIVRNDTGPGKTGKVYVLSNDGRYVAPPPGAEGLIGERSNFPCKEQYPSTPILRYLDWRGTPVMGVAAPFPQIDLLLVAESDESEVYSLLNHLMLSAVATGIFTLMLIFFISIRGAQSLSRPLRKLADAANNIARGNYRARVPPLKYKEVSEVGDTFNKMLDRLEITQLTLAHKSSLAAVGELSSSIVHEMRSPLSSIKMSLQALKKKVANDPPYREMADIGGRQLQRLETMLTDLLSFSKPLQIKPEVILFRVLSQDVTHATMKNLEDKNQTLEVNDRLGDKPLYVDRELLGRALTNLIMNASQFSPSEATIEFSAQIVAEKGSWISMQIRDEGPGIQDRHRKHLFRPFFTTRPEGTGLGLANVKKIVEHHGGIVFAQDGSTGGAAFTIHLPPTVFES
jgi:signal transduction histidine kinase